MEQMGTINKRVNILDLPVDAVTLHDACERVVDHWRQRTHKTMHIVTINPEMMMMAQNYPRLKEAIWASDLVVPDGIGVVWAAKTYGRPLPERVPGIDLAENLLARAATHGRKVFLLGGREGVAQGAAERLIRRFSGLNIVGTHHGYLSTAEEEQTVEGIAQHGVDLLLVGLGVPKQELWIHKHRSALGGGVIMGVGGALDVFAGHVQRAPMFWQRAGLEWAYRLMMQPSRIVRMAALPRFVFAVLKRR